jgi:hypothetical protein
MTEITQNPHKIPITEEMIPIVVQGDEVKMVRITVDGRPASCFLSERVWGSTKVVIVFDQEHPRWGEYFMTKYFMFDEPGKMHWGHDGDYMEIEATLLTIDGPDETSL